MGELVPGKILSTIPILPYVFEVNVYGKWLDAAESFGRAFYPFSYDWRRDNNETVAIFERFLETVAQRHGASRVDVVAHSMGGLITLAVLNRRTDLVHRVVFAGVPFPGGIGFLPDLHEGTATGFNDDIAGPDVLATFPSVYALFPRQSDAMVDASGRPLDVDFFSLDSWEQLGLGMFAPGKTPPTPADREFFSEALSRARAFRDRLIPRVFTYPQALVVASRAHPTLAKAIRGGPKSVGGWDFESAPKEEGDERVAFKNAMPPPGVTYEVVETPAEHSELLNDGAVIERIRKFLDEGDPAVSFP
jgi:pimeloyl-ACP methyl ester carboxylesterase